ncbi:MAG: DUF2075 domain-containing protein [Aquiluna sp.]|nr:DUF2075 domain-containing protein [Aquiluna sp.]
MTGFRIERFPFDSSAIQVWQQANRVNNNWPVVYAINNDKQIYVGETVNAATRMHQHLSTPQRQQLESVQIILTERSNKSVCLDLESQLIRYFAADGKFQVLNGNAGISDADYYQREEYRKSFDELFNELHEEGFLTRTVPELINSNLFKYSPFKALNKDQSIALSGILERLLGDLEDSISSELVIQGDPGTGKTIVAIYLVKLLRDIATHLPDDLIGDESAFAEYFTPRNKELVGMYRIGLVVPQQSLRKTIQDVFDKTPGLGKEMILSPFDVGMSQDSWDLLIVDEAHRLGIRANQSSAQKNRQFGEINEKLFGEDSLSYTQLDWIRARSRNRILMVDSAQSIRPADLPKQAIDDLISRAKRVENFFLLTSQMRVTGGEDYISFVQSLLSDVPVQASGFGSYELRLFDSFIAMKREVIKKNHDEGLARLLAGFAWPWNSKQDNTAFDIEIEGERLFWNRSKTDWVNSKTSIDEVGSIHTIQGYDLNYAGVIIGPDISFDEESQKIVFNRDNYFDVKGRENNKKLGLEFTDENIRQYVLNIYRVLMTRGIRGTFVYVVDEPLRRHLGRHLPYPSLN